MTDHPTPPPTAHAAVTRGLERALRGLGVDLVGCAPSVLSGHVIKELREDGLLHSPDEGSATGDSLRELATRIELEAGVADRPFQPERLGDIAIALRSWALVVDDLFGNAKATTKAIDAKEAEMREWLDRHNSDCECEVGETWLEAIAWFRTLRAPREAS